MSIIPVGVPLALAAAQLLIGPVLVRPRKLGPFVADVTIEEIHRDRLVATRHPVEQGAAITDHSYKEPAELVVRAGWSSSGLTNLFNPNYVQTVYAAFLALQASRQTFSILTGKRSYTNMLCTMLQVTTDERTENALMMTAECHEILIAQTQVVTVGSSANMTTPAVNGATQNTGTNALGAGGQNNYNPTPPAH
ncbi:MAG: phage baseplate protein [Rhodomicrobium sp.]